MARAAPEHDTAEAARETGRLAAWTGWATASRGRMISALALAGLGSTLVAAGLYWVAVPRSQHDENYTLQMALDALDRGEFTRAGEIAAALREQGVISDLELGGPAFVTGAVLVHETDDRWGKDKSAAYRLAARHLEEARDRGFPSGRDDEGLMLLAHCQFEASQFTDAAFTLSQLLKRNPPNRSQVLSMLAKAHFHNANPNYEQALAANAEYLANRMLPEAKRNAGLLFRCEVLRAMRRHDECRETLESIPKNAQLRGDALLLEGQLLLAAARARRSQDDAQSDAAQAEIKDQYTKAIHLFRESQAHDSIAENARAKALYLLGIAFREMGDTPAALNQLSRVSKLYPATDEGLAAELMLAIALRESGQEEEAIAAYRRAFTAAGPPSSYSNTWLSLSAFRGQMLAAYRYYVSQDKYELALKLLDGFTPLVSRLETIEYTAQCYRAWAESLDEEAAQAPESRAAPLHQEAARHWRKAGYTYSKLARRRAATRKFPNDIWNSAQCLLEGHDYRTATTLLETYLKNESRGHRPQALVALGRASLALGQLEKAKQSFTECIEFYPRDAAVYDARVWSAKAHAESGEYPAAQRLLLDNLQGSTLTPASREWRDSLFELGKLLMAQGRHAEAIIKLEEAVARYPETPEAAEGLYLIAEAHREAAKDPQRKLREATIESVRISHRRQIKDLLEGALDHYTRVQAALLRREEEYDLSRLESAMLRNCYFSIGTVLFDLGRYEDAIKAFSDASTRYQNEPLVLEAFVQIADCHRRLGRTIESRGALEQAKVVWKRLPPDAAFAASTNYNRDEWIKLLNQLSSW